MSGQKVTRRQKDISRLIREKKYSSPRPLKKSDPLPARKKNRLNYFLVISKPMIIPMAVPITAIAITLLNDACASGMNT